MAGIGINVHPASVKHLPQPVRETAVSLGEVTKKPLRRAQIVASCCTEIENLMSLYEEKGFSPIRTLWESYAFMLGKQVTVRTSDGTKSGEAIGLDQSGALVLKTPSGTERIYSADMDLSR